MDRFRVTLSSPAVIHHPESQSRRSAHALPSVHDDTRPAEILLRVKGPNCSSELIGLYDVIARLMSLSLQYGPPPVRRSAISSLQPSVFHVGPIVGHDRITHRTSVLDFIGSICWWSTADMKGP
jgi:hypothetical protein